MADDVTYTNTAAQLATPPSGTPIRATESSEAGHTGKLIQHVYPDAGDGTIPPTSLSTTDRDIFTDGSFVASWSTADKDILTDGSQVAQLSTIDRDILTDGSLIAKWSTVDVDMMTNGTVAVKLSTASTNTVVITKASLSGSLPTSASVGSTSAEAVPANANRTGLVLVNTSTSIISIAFDSSAVLYNGITLNPGGGTFVMDEFTYTTDQIQAIAAAAASNLAIQEFD